VVVGVLHISRAVAWIVRTHGLGPAPHSTQLTDQPVKAAELRDQGIDLYELSGRASNWLIMEARLRL
jgi:hypothetical protein